MSKLYAITTFAVVAVVLALHLKAEQPAAQVNYGECRFIENEVRPAHMHGRINPIPVPERVYDILYCPDYTRRFATNAP